MMMKQIRIFSALLLILCIQSSLFSQCKLAEIVQANKLQIPAPFKYDGFTMTHIGFDQINHQAKTEFMAFKGQKYKLIFCTSGFEEQVSVSITDKSAPGAQLAAKVIGDKETSWIFEPAKAGTYSILFDIPPSNTEVEHKGCIVMLIGFSDK